MNTVEAPGCHSLLHPLASFLSLIFAAKWPAEADNCTEEHSASAVAESMFLVEKLNEREMGDSRHAGKVEMSVCVCVCVFMLSCTALCFIL